MTDYFFLKKITIAVILSISVSVVSINYPSYAQTGSHNTEPKARIKAPLIRQKIYDRLSQAQQLVQNEKYQKATLILDKIKKYRRLNSTELTQLWNFYAYIYYSQELYPQAIKAYKTLLQQAELQPAIKFSTLYTLSQLYFLTEDYAKALVRIKQWIQLSEQPSADAYAFLGQAYYRLKNYKQSIAALKKAIHIQNSAAKKVKENWYLLLRANYFELNDYNNMAEILTEVITIYPKPLYFRDLASAYSQLGDTLKQLGIMEVMYEKGLLENASQIKNLANLLLIHEVPYKSAKVVDKAIRDGLLKRNAKNYELLARSWMQAREDQQAIEPLTAAAKLSDQGESWINLGRAYFNLDQWTQAVKSLQQGLQKKGVKKPDIGYILLGMSYYNLKQLKEARQAFSQAVTISHNKHNTKTATQWIHYLQSEIKRESFLAGN